MTRILIDTNVILDLLGKREPFYLDSLQIFSLADHDKLELVVSSLSLVNAQYVISEKMKIRESREVIRKLKVLVRTIELSEKVIDSALGDLSFQDFEDGIQFYTAIESNCKVIVTRNVKDFRNSTIPVMSPGEFLSNFGI